MKKRDVKPTTRKYVIFDAILVLLSIGGGLICVELLVRWLQLTQPVYPSSETALNLYYTDPNGLIRLTPGWQGYIGGIWTTISEQGWRDRAFALVPPSDAMRIAVIGDSYTMGDGVEIEDAYPKQLESLLLSAGYRTEVMNCGVSATNSFNQLAILQQIIADYHPHFIILGYNINDFDYPTVTKFERQKAAGVDFVVHPDQRVSVRPNHYTRFQQTKLTLQNQLYLYRYLVHIRERWQSRSEQTDPVRQWLQQGAHLRSLDAVAQMNALCQQRQIGFFVAILPDLLRVSRTVHDIQAYPYQDVHAIISDTLEREHVKHRDLLPLFAGHDLQDLVVHPLDHHFDQEGNRIVAQAIFDTIQALFLKGEFYDHTL